ncbi:hypothetical protein GQ600_24104 [Phytophthora cactorum]|nr:hypothetical protein GQ600_24104 [Phytophthora cactorum]
MASDYEDEIVDDEDAICGWGQQTLMTSSWTEVAQATARETEPSYQSRSENQNEHRVHRKFKRKQPHEVRELQHHQNPKPSPRTTSIQEENAAIAAIGRQRRMRVVAAAMAANVPRKSGMASVVSASFTSNLMMVLRNRRNGDQTSACLRQHRRNNK